MRFPVDFSCEPMRTGYFVRMSNTAPQVTLTILLANGRNIEFQVATVEQAILAFRKLSKSLDHVGATYTVEGKSFCQIR